MKLKFRGSITTKLLLVNALILGIFGVIIILIHTSFIKETHTSFSNIESSLTTIIDRDVNQVIQNAQLGRALTRVFADTNLLTSTFYEHEELLKTEGERLSKTTAELLTQITDTRLRGAFQQFNDKFRNLLMQGLAVNKGSQETQMINQEISTTLAALDETISEKLVTALLEGEDPSLMEQLNISLPVYRETILQIAVEFVKVKREHSSAGKPEDQYPTLFSLLDDLSMRFQTLTTSEPEIAEYGQQLIRTLQKYRTTIITFHQLLTEFQTFLNEMNEARDQVLSIMNAIDKRIEQTTVNIQKDVTGVMKDSNQTISILSAVFISILSIAFIGILGIAWFSTRLMTKPLVHLSRCAAQLAEGDIECDVWDIKSHDEIGTLSRAFRGLMAYFREMARAVTEISQGNLELNVKTRSRKDVLGNGFQHMIMYLKNMGNLATYVAQGDLRSQISLRTQTDQLGNAFVHMQQGLIALIAEIRSGADYIASISKQVLSTSSNNANALEHIGNAAEVTSSAMRQVNSSAEEMRMNTEHLSTSIEETTASISQMISSIKHVAENSRKLSAFADDTRTTMGNMVHSLETVADQAEHSKLLAETTTQDAVSGQDSVEQMINRMATISDVTKDISDIVSRLKNRSQEIDTILDVINEVADQTSLLALNASIIAAQAGVHGRGFAVVADEIKELATRVGTSTKEIAKIVKSVQRDSSDAVNALEQGQREVESGVAVAHRAGEALQKIGHSAENSSRVAAEIAVLVREQTTSSTRIAESIQDVTNMINEITRATQEQEKNSSQLFTVIENMQTLAIQVMRATQEQQQSTLHVTEFMEDVISLVSENMPTVKQLAQSANELADQSDVLKKQVERFILPERDEI